MQQSNKNTCNFFLQLYMSMVDLRPELIYSDLFNNSDVLGRSHVVSFPTVSQRMIHSVALHIESFKWMLYRILDRVAISE